MSSCDRIKMSISDSKNSFVNQTIDVINFKCTNFLAKNVISMLTIAHKSCTS